MALMLPMYNHLGRSPKKKKRKTASMIVAEKSHQKYLKSMGLDKKVVDGRLRFIVASQLGQVQVRDDIDAAVLRNVLAQC